MATHSCVFAWRSCVDTGARRVTVHGVAKRSIRLKTKREHNTGKADEAPPPSAYSARGASCV